jgi:hypothetical protein
MLLHLGKKHEQEENDTREWEREVERQGRLQEAWKCVEEINEKNDMVCYILGLINHP